MGCGCPSYKIADSSIITKKSKPKGLISGNKFLFPKPPLSNYLSENPSNIFQISSNLRKVPILFLPCANSNKLIFYMHGNCEDIGHVNKLMTFLQSKLQVSVLALEYPGYGFYRNIPTDSNIIDEDCTNVLKYIIEVMGVPMSRVIIMGRSIGTGPAAYQASINQALCVILISPFSSIRDICMNIVGTLGYFLVQQRWVTSENMKHTQIPALVIHGRDDSLIPYQHSEIISKGFVHKKSVLKIFDDMDHNSMDFDLNIATPIDNFLKTIDDDSFPRLRFSIEGLAQYTHD